MTATAFVEKWTGCQRNERAAAQEHFIDLCAVVGVDTPNAADPSGDWYAFEKGAEKVGGGDGFADVWKRGHFAWEYKGKRKNLVEAYRQLLLYREALENPPLLVVCDLERVRVRAVVGKWLTAPDQVIARIAAMTRGYYDLSTHHRELVMRPVMIEGRRVAPEAILEVNARRLERLERYKLVERISDRCWKVPPNLVDLLRDRERTHPQHRIEIERLDRTVDRTRDRRRGFER